MSSAGGLFTVTVVTVTAASFSTSSGFSRCRFTRSTDMTPLSLNENSSSESIVLNVPSICRCVAGPY